MRGRQAAHPGDVGQAAHKELHHLHRVAAEGEVSAAPGDKARGKPQVSSFAMLQVHQVLHWDSERLHTLAIHT